MYEICIIGAGVTGLSLLLLLQNAGYDLSRVVIIDPYFDGGDLARKWTSVLSNTPWSKSYNALVTSCPNLDWKAFEKKGDDMSKSTPLIELAQCIVSAAKVALSLVGEQIQSQATQVEWLEGAWTISIKGGAPVQSKRVVLAQGSEPRQQNLPIPSIPLEIALDSQRLKHYVKGGQKVLVFGTMHSGSLVIRNLVKVCGAKVSAFYNTEAPFVWDRDGAYDGIKGEAAEIADSITKGEYESNLRLAPISSIGDVIRSSRAADWVVYAMGFSSREIHIKVNGSILSSSSYNGDTGEIVNAPAAWGFGIAYPNRAPDRIHWDVSLAAFLEHMKKQLPSLLQS